MVMHMPSTDLGRGLLSLAMFPVVFVVATLVGGGILAAQGYESGESVPTGLVVAVGLPLVALLLAPLVLAWRFGRRAAASGDRRGQWVDVCCGTCSVVHRAIVPVRLVARRGRGWAVLR